MALPSILSASDVVQRFCPLLERYEEIYKDLHRHPELSLQESRTSKLAAEHLRGIGYHVTVNIGGFGVVGSLENGVGPSVLLRAEMDALPILEETGLPFASRTRMRDVDGIEKPVSHACGHDMHLTCLLAAARLLYDARAAWTGQLSVLFQPNEERGGGARAMIQDRLYEKDIIPTPDVVLGQHMVNIRCGDVATRSGPSLAGKQVFEVTVFGRGGHGCAPQDCVDPIVIASHIVTRLQSIASRETDPNKMVVITCGSFHAGDEPNCIPDVAVLKVDIRAYDEGVLKKAVAALHRITVAECEASRAPTAPSIKQLQHVPPLICDGPTVAALTAAFKGHFGEEHVAEMSQDTAADDFSLLAPPGVPCAYWNFGSEDRQVWQQAYDQDLLSRLPANHSSNYAPVVERTLQTGTHALAVAALTFLQAGSDAKHPRN